MHKEGKNFFLISQKLGFAMNGFQPRQELIKLKGKSLPLKYYICTVDKEIRSATSVPL